MWKSNNQGLKEETFIQVVGGVETGSQDMWQVAASGPGGPTIESAPEGPNLLVGSGDSD